MFKAGAFTQVMLLKGWPIQQVWLYQIYLWPLNPSLAEHDMPCLSKQCFSASEQANWSGYVNFYQKPGSSNLIGMKLEVDMAS